MLGSGTMHHVANIPVQVMELEEAGNIERVAEPRE